MTFNEKALYGLALLAVISGVYGYAKSDKKSSDENKNNFWGVGVGAGCVLLLLVFALRSVTSGPTQEDCKSEEAIDAKHRACTKAARTTNPGGETHQSYQDCKYPDKPQDYIVKDGKLCEKSMGRRIGERMIAQ